MKGDTKGSITREAAIWVELQQADFGNFKKNV